MKKMGFISVVMVLLISLSFGTPVLASVAPQGTIVPCYSYISTIGSGLSINSGGYSTCSGFINIYVNYSSTITITLQRSSNGSSWTNIKSWSQSFSTTGLNSIEKGYYVESGYFYRVLTTAQVKNGNTVLETATCYSAVKSY